MSNKEKILLAAFKLFSENGFIGTTTKSIAKAAEVNEVTIFRNFGSKKKIFLEMIKYFSRQQNYKFIFTDKITWNYKKDLYLIGSEYMKIIRKNRAGILMTLNESIKYSEVGKLIKNSPVRLITLFAEYLIKQCKNKLVRSLPDPTLAARSFLGMIFDYCITDIDGYSDGEYKKALDSFVDIFYEGTTAD